MQARRRRWRRRSARTRARSVRWRTRCGSSSGARDGSCDYVNRQWREYTGTAESEQFGWGWLDQVHAEDRERVREEWRVAVKNGDQLETELRIRRADGAYRWVRTRSVQIQDGTGATVKWYGTCIDIHDAK